MARYRKIDVRIWNDEQFAAFSDDGKLAFLFLLTHPNLTSLGAMRATRAGLAEELGWSLAKFSRAFAAILAADMAQYDARSAFLWLPNFLKYNQPESPNVVTGWGKALDLLPECAMRSACMASAHRYTQGLPEAFAKAFEQVFAKIRANQEQEQEQEPDPKPDPPKRDQLGDGGSGRAPVARLVSSSTSGQGSGPERMASMELVALWNSIRGASVDFTELQADSKRELKIALQTKSVSSWERIFRRASESDYLAGRLDFPAAGLFRVIDLADRIDEGQYDNRTAKPAESVSGMSTEEAYAAFSAGLAAADARRRR